MAEQIFKKGTADFKKILADQKKQESDPKFALSDALQEYKDKLEKTAGYKSAAKLDKAGIRQDVINFVDDYSITDLDSIKGMEYEDAIRLQKNTEKKINEFEGLYKQDILTKEELDFIKDTVGKTNDQLKSVLGIGTRLTLAFRDLKKELTPLKLAQRVGLTRIPIIGKRIERAIEAEEEGEREALQLKRQLRRKEARLGRKDEDLLDDDLSLAQTQTKRTKEKTAKKAVQDLFAPKPSSAGMLGGKERMIEEERESDEQFKTSSGLLEDILEESKLTNELLSGKKGGAKGVGGDKEGGFSLLEMLGINAGLKTGKGVLGKMKKFLKSPKTMGRAAMTLGRTAVTGALGLGATTLTALAAITAPLAAVTYAVKKKGDEYIELMKKGQIRAEDSPQFHSQYIDPYGDEAGTGYIPPVPEAPGTYDNTEFLKQLGEKPYTKEELGAILEKEAKDAQLKAEQKTLAGKDLNRMSTDETYMPDNFVPPQDKNLRASELSTSGVERSVNSVSNSYNTNTVVNQQNNDNKRIDNNRSDTSNVSIGVGNPDSKAQILSNVY